MRITAFSALALGFGLASVQLAACSDTAGDCNATASCNNAGTAGSSTSGSGGEGTTAGTSNGGSEANGGSSSQSGSSGSMGTAGAGAGAGGGGGGSCEGDVSDDAACWTTNDYGVFVSSEAGDDGTADGTKELPYKTIGKAITAAVAGGKNVYVCVGSDDYQERIMLDHPSTEVRIYGGFECETWTYDTARRAQVISPSNIALRLQFSSQPATGERL